MTIHFANTDACVNMDGTDVHIRKGQRFDDSDAATRAIVKRWPDYFEAPNVEQATAAPGEKRATRRG